MAGTIAAVARRTATEPLWCSVRHIAPSTSPRSCRDVDRSKRRRSAALMAVPMASHPSVVERLARLAPDQRAAATAPPGPLLCVAPAGQRQDDDARRPRRLARSTAGVDPASIAAITFNKRAAEELTERLDAALAPLGRRAGRRPGPDVPRARARDPARRRRARRAARRPRRDPAPSVAPAAPTRPAVAARPRDLAPQARPPRVSATTSRPTRTPGPFARAFVAYERAVAASGGLDFDDLVVRAIAPARGDPALLGRWRARCAELLVDEVAGRRPGAAPARAAPRGAGEPDLPGRRRRPVDLRLAAGRCPAGPGARGPPARASDGWTSR